MAGSISDLKAEISNRKGLARTNKFNVFFTPPSQALINIDIGTILSSLARGDFNKNQLISDPRSLTLLCESASLPGSKIDAQAHTLTGAYPEQRATGRGFDTIDFSFLVTNDFYIRRMFDDWQDMIITPDYHVGYNDDYTCDVTIQQLNQENDPVYGVTLYNAFPTSIGAMQLTSAPNGESKITITMAYDKYVTQNAISSSLSSVRNAIAKKLIG